MPSFETPQQAASRPRLVKSLVKPLAKSSYTSAASPRGRATARSNGGATRHTSVGWQRMTGLALLGIAGAGGALFAIDAMPRSSAGPWEMQKSAFQLAERAAFAAGFVVKRIDVKGHRYTSAREVEAAIGIGEKVSQLSLQPAGARRRVEALPWVQTAVVRRSLPDGVTVEITERKPVALWRQPNRDLLIDVDGRTLSEVSRGADVGLLVVLGEGADVAVARLIALVAEHGQIQRRLVEAHRIEARRWTLRLSNGLLLHLPADGVAAALAWLEARAAGSLLDAGLEAIDLRVAGQLVVRGGADTRGQRARLEHLTALTASPYSGHGGTE